MAARNAELLGRYLNGFGIEGIAEGQIMTDLERELALKITTGQTVGAGIFMNEVEYKAYAARTYGLTEQRITELVRELLEGG